MIEEFLSPISNEQPCGEYLKLNKSEYRSLRNSYNNALSSFRKLIETPENCFNEDFFNENNKNWQMFSELAKEKLLTKTKDLEILCWYLTAQIFTRDYIDNIHHGIEILHQWLLLFWEDLNPRLSQDKLETTEDQQAQKSVIEAKVLPLMQFAGDSINNCALYAPMQVRGFIGELTFGDYITAELNEDLESLKAEANNCFDSSMIDVVLTLGKICSSLELIEVFIQEKCKSYGVVFHLTCLKAVFDKMLSGIKYLVGHQLVPWPLDATNENEIQENKQNELDTLVLVNNHNEVSKKNNDINENNLNTNGLSNRDDAFNQLRVIADFFKKTEPHSPIPFLLERAIRWGYMALPDLITEMIANGNEQVIEHIKLVTGMDNLSALPASESHHQTSKSSKFSTATIDKDSNKKQSTVPTKDKQIEEKQDKAENPFL